MTRPPLDSPSALACDRKARPSTPARIRRLTAAQYEHTARALLGSSGLPAGLTNPFDDAPPEGSFSTHVAAVTIPEQTLSLVLDAAEGIAKALVPALRGRHPCLQAPPASQACFDQVLGAIGATAFRRPLTEEELGRFTTLARGHVEEADPDAGLRLGLSALLASPQFTFLWERGGGTPDAAGRVRLQPRELAAALSYAITDGPPDAMLLAAAERRELETPAQIRAQVARLLGGLETRASALRFFQEYFGYTKAPDVFKDPEQFPFHAAEALVDDTDRFVRAALAERKGFLTSLLAAPAAFVRADTAKSYGVNVTSKAPARVDLPRAERAGILTQPSFLVAFSHPEENDPVHRGKFVSEALLCREIPPLPLPDVPEPPQAPTLRGRLKAHSDRPECAACHRLMDPLGFALEQFDHTGRFRTTENGHPVDASGVVTGAGDADGPFQGPVELATRLARSRVVGACVARHAFRYWLGRQEVAADACVIDDAFDAYERGGGDIVEMFATILTSDSFLYRTPN